MLSTLDASMPAIFSLLISAKIVLRFDQKPTLSKEPVAVFPAPLHVTALEQEIEKLLEKSPDTALTVEDTRPPTGEVSKEKSKYLRVSDLVPIA